MEGLDPAQLFARALHTVQPSIGQTAWIPPEPEELARLLPQYCIESLLGHGGMGAVYKGRQPDLDRPVAIKLLPAEIAADEQFIARFRREARTLAKLQHSGIVSVYDFGQTSEGHLYFVMEFVEGTDLHKILQGPGLNPAQSLELISQVCDALHYAHSKGVIHRDIKPGNILVTSDGRVKLADFGLARPIKGESSVLTGRNVMMGTADYMAPEQRDGHADQRADIYALGVMLYEMLTGKRPHGVFNPPSHRVQLDIRLDQVVLKALQQAPERRYQQVSEMKTDVDRIRTTPPPALGADLPATKIDTAPPTPRQKRFALVAAAILACAGAAGLFIWERMRNPSHTPSADGIDSRQKMPSPAPQKTLTPAEAEVLTAKVRNATKEQPFVNTLGQEFVPVPGTQVLFCRWETRVKDYAEFARKHYVDDSWTRQELDGVPVSRAPEYPVCALGWIDAKAFCQWLTEKEISEGKLLQGMSYRLPTDEEWSRAVGLAKEEGETPRERSGQNRVDYPWGLGFPPPKAKTGNYTDAAYHERFPKYSWMEGYADGHAMTSPVGSFAANAFGLYDLGGNVWEWCEDPFERESTNRVLRGASWDHFEPDLLRSSTRLHLAPAYRSRNNGFRCVLGPASGIPATAAKDAPFVNSLGMKFVSVPISGGPPTGQRVLFSVWETRVQDYEVFVKEMQHEWAKPPFPQDPTHPAVNINSDDAQAFCSWLTARERKMQRLGPAERYRLPTDHEWSCAVGIGELEDPAKTPWEKSMKLAGVYPWGITWPSPPGAGNYSGTEATGHKMWEGQQTRADYHDDFPTTAPVGSFAANRFGVFDLGGNIWEWAQDPSKTAGEPWLIRGASYGNEDFRLSSSYRGHAAEIRPGNYGCRLVLTRSSSDTK